MQLRTVRSVIDSIETIEGGGFTVRRPFPTPTLDHFDPFLLLDEGGPIDYKPGEAKGLPDHPHRGFETLTYFIDGTFENWDSTGFRGVLNAGDIEWTTAGAGIVHGGAPHADMVRAGGRIHMFQLWINLAANKKFIPPQSQDIRADLVPLVAIPAVGRVKVIAGEYAGHSGAVAPTTPTLYVHVTLEPNAAITIPIEEEHNAFVYLVEGDARIGERTVATSQVALLHRNGEGVEVTAGAAGASLLLLAGQPLNEPVARYGPFVMNTREEIIDAFKDYQSGKFA